MDTLPSHDGRIGATQPGGAGNPLVVGILDGDRMFWPEVKLSFASDGFMECTELDDRTPQDWSYLVAQVEEMSA